MEEPKKIAFDLDFLVNLKRQEESEQEQVVHLTDEEIEKAKQQADEEMKVTRFKESGVGQRYFDKKLEDFIATTDEQKKQLHEVKRFIEDVKQKIPRTLWLCGGAGTGKTFLSAMIIRECGGHFCKSYQIEDDLEVAKSFSAKENKVEVLERYYKYKILVIDEIAKFENKQWQELEYLFRILNERYERNLSTIIVTNKSGKELREYLGIPLYDRFITNCTLLEFTGKSYRINERGDK